MGEPDPLPDNVFELASLAGFHRQQPRDEIGRYSGAKPPDQLLSLLEVGLHTAAELYDKDSREVTQSLFNQAIPTIERKTGRSVPKANELVRQLNKALRRGQPRYSWEQWRVVAHGDRGDPQRVLEKLVGAAEKQVTLADALVTLAIYTSELGHRPRTEHEWDSARREIISREHNAGRGSGVASERLLTYKQFASVAGSLETAAAHLGLKDPQPRTKVTGLPIPDGIAVFYSENGWLPSLAELLRFRSKHQFALASSKGRSWNGGWLPAGIERIASFPELCPPPPPGIKQPPPEWRPTMLPIELPPPSVPGYSRLAVLEHVHTCLREWLPQTEKKILTNRLWRQYSLGKHGIPSLGVLVEHGGVRALTAEVTTPGWQHRAKDWKDPRPQLAQRLGPPPTPEQLAEREHMRHTRAAARPNAQLVLNHIRQHGEATARDLTAALGWNHWKTKRQLAALVKTGALVLTQPLASTNQTYRLGTIEGKDAD